MIKAALTLTIISTMMTTVMAQTISSDFPFESKFLDVFGSKMHYIEEYADATNPDQLTFLFLHGNPTSNYLWRNIIPYVKGHGSAIAPDLIGMGKSDKPNIDYTLQDHIRYLDEFIKQKDLDNIVLVIHDWGSALGFHYAFRNESKIRGMVFMEAMTRPAYWRDANFIERFMLKRFRDDKKGYKMLVEKNFIIKTFLFKIGVKRKLSEEEKAYYLAPYHTVESRKLIGVWPKEIPIDSTPERNHTIVSKYAQWLKETPIPKLLLYAKPGFIIKKKDVVQMQNDFRNFNAVYLGKGTHYLQEDHPHEIGNAMVKWLKLLK
ncbi:MAG: haloalkane dehalogenase [Flavobacteriales bacterium]|nr:haloalkane dehalogenase [Flavobacteriales bacterium]